MFCRLLKLFDNRFDSNYHYVVPELSGDTDFKLVTNKAVEEHKEAKALGITTRPVILGPVSYLFLSKAAKDAKPGFHRCHSFATLDGAQGGWCRMGTSRRAYPCP